MPWSTPFDDPIPVGLGELVTLKDAAEYIQELPKGEQTKPHWMLAVSILIDVAERRDLTMHARIAIMRALNADKPPPAQPKRTKARKPVTIIR